MIYYKSYIREIISGTWRLNRKVKQEQIINSFGCITTTWKLRQNNLDACSELKWHIRSWGDWRGHRGTCGPVREHAVSLHWSLYSLFKLPTKVPFATSHYWLFHNYTVIWSRWNYKINILWDVVKFLLFKMSWFYFIIHLLLWNGYIHIYVSTHICTYICTCTYILNIQMF